VAVDANGTPWLLTWREETSFLGESERRSTMKALPAPSAAVTALHVDARGNQAFFGTSRGRLERWDLRDPAAPQRTDDVVAAVRENAPITALAPLIGNQSLVVGDAAGGIGVWFAVRDEHGIAAMRRVHRFAPSRGAVTAIAASPRDRGFVTADAAGMVRVHHATTTQTLLELAAGTDIRRVVFAPKADGVLGVGSAGAVVHWAIDNPHPEVSLQTLFGKVWYEGYEEPAYVWQSTGGSDAFEPKLSLVPLVVGTLKGTFYALFFAVPLAVLAALYTSQFSHPSVRATVKPVVEIMAALPSVVLGFLAGLWLAPLVEGVVPGVLLSIFLIPTLIFVVAIGFHAAPRRAFTALPRGTEVLFLCLLVAVGFQLSLALNDPIESLLFGGDFRGWLHANGMRFDQRNSLVVGVAMGFAVIPLIFTISEDALSNVPQRLVSASLALGATRWQTALKVVVPTASPGIFSAIMIGFGRAVGETMIVLMATGNTPVLDWSIFTGMRTLSANIAVEIPEAPHGGTLYRILFLAAMLLFLVTFVTNTAAELVRQRLRRRYQAI
jgi:phosphate transport system permease protein